MLVFKNKQTNPELNKQTKKTHKIKPTVLLKSHFLLTKACILIKGTLLFFNLESIFIVHKDNYKLNTFHFDA